MDDSADRDGAREGREAESAAAEGRIDKDDDLWLPRASYISVTSGERVRGKTLLAANLAYGLLARGRRVALVNADWDRPDIVDVIGSSRAEPARDMMSSSDGLGGIAAVDVVHLSRVSSDAEGDRAGGAVIGAGLLHGLELAGREAQIVIIDTSPWADHSRAIWRIAALSIVVAEPGSDKMRSAYVTIKRIRSVSPNARIGLVLNCVRSYAEGEDCFRKLAEVCRRFLKTNLRNYGCVLHDVVVSEAHETATPLVRAFPDSKAAKCIEAILGLIVMDESAIARRRREVTYEECALRKGRLQALKSSAF
jgi:flagellar biosynthesis protein FlhG